MAERPSSSFQRAATALATFVAPTTVIIGLLYYFGYIRTAALYAYFGIDIGALSFSTQDYLMRSVDALYVPLGCLMLVILAVVWLWWFAEREIIVGGRVRALRPVAYTAIVVGSVLFGLGIVGIIQPAWSWEVATPLSLGVGALLTTSGVMLVLREKKVAASTHHKASLGLVIVIILLSLFWTANQYAQAYARGRAETLTIELKEQPGVIVDTTDRLFADAPGVTETALTDGGKYKFRYRGYRVLVRSPSTVFLLPEGWTHGNGSILAVRDDESIRMQFRTNG